MRVAVVHDWLTERGGAERVTRELADLFQADVFALVDFLSDEDRAHILHGKRARTTFIQRSPFARSHFRWYLPFFPRAIESLDLSGYDLIISSSYAVAKGVRKRPGQKHVCYIHTPMRYAWVDEEGYLQDHGIRSWRAALVRHQLGRIRRWDKAGSEHVDRFIANSRNVADRVQRFYGRTADVVLPPVDPDLFTLYTGARSGYITVSRLVPYKRIDRVIVAFNSLPALELTVVGHGPDLVRLRSLAAPHIRFAGPLGDADLVKVMQRSRALVCAANEDLGLTALEAQACGTPVIAWQGAGYLETVDVTHGGRYFPTASAEAIRAAVLLHEAAKDDLSPERSRAHVAPHFRERFRERIAAIVQEVITHA